MALQKHGSTSFAHRPTTEFDVLKSSHRFLRSDEEEEKDLTWDDRVAKKYYDSLYREFAVCDLKHYKSGQFALRWRTEAEVLSGAGEITCGNTRCKHHSPELETDRARLNTIELPFAYSEHGEAKSALVKVVLCDRCMKKLMYQRTKEKEKLSTHVVKKEEELDSKELLALSANGAGEPERKGRSAVDAPRRRNSRSLSPQRRKHRHRRHAS